MWASCVRFVSMSLFSLIASVSFSFLCAFLLSLHPRFFLLSVITFRGMLCRFWRWIKCFPLSLCYFKSPLQSVSLHLLVTCGHVCMTEEMQSLAQTITICLVCTIYMKYIFIHDTRAHGIASCSFFACLSYAITESLCTVQEVFQMKTLVSLMSLISYKVACYVSSSLFSLFKCTWITPCSLLLLQERVQKPFI